MLDELRDADEVEINEIVLPLMNVARRLPDNTVNEKEVNAQQIVMTSAGSKSHFSYDKLIDMFESSIITPNDAFVIGLDYRIPIAHGLLDKTYVNKLKMSPSFNAQSFAREYLSLWSGSSEDSWFNYDKISKYRKLKNPEWAHQKARLGDNGFYLLSMDVGRLGDRSEVCVFRVNPQNGIFYATLVNIITLGRTPETRQFSYQARDLKRLIKLYQPKEVLIDTNGLDLGHFKSL